ncbi:hypothetical protein OK349_03400 [Sphingomonas sp. BT-65]|uniref:hypothetical protein n=1 Tax=Sphingomonas sp. BT-65 TaxID=2989821 RepID=UPI002235FE68|nr:hypothetical protein [Sphingomonas sp. BT-65]MCW4460739.1 hypothetical protein [Sphingomonas sp. BT-65]
MAIEPLLTGSVFVVSAVAPPVLARFSRLNGGAIFFASIGLAMAASEIVFRIANPDFNYGPLHGLAIVMHICISAVVVGLATLLALWLRGNRTERDLP